jgi:carboxylesterase type B
VISEDCLYLNVYAPRAVNVTKLQPVMVFLHGGHFDQGAAGTEELVVFFLFLNSASFCHFVVLTEH